MDFFKIFELFSHIIFILSAGFYLITNLQWFSYKLERVIKNHTKKHWHIIYLFLPIIFYFIGEQFFWIYLYFAYIPSLIVWHKKLDKKLVITDRVKRFFALLLISTIFQDILCLIKSDCVVFGVILPLVVTLFGSQLIEKILLNSYKKKAIDKLAKISPIVIAITASYGKTSIKNFLSQLLSRKFNIHYTPKSVNTTVGIIQDINSNLKENTEIYIVEAGARRKGDILEIANLIKPDYVIVGKVGEQHIEYFKTLQNIIDTKLELLNSKKLKKALIYEDLPKNENSQIIKFPKNLEVLSSNLDGIKFSLEINSQKEIFEAPILGSFNAINISATIYLALILGLELDYIKSKIRELKPIEHRLQKIEAGEKIILDDSFNGNLEGVLEAIKVSSTYSGRKVIITPGLVESTKEANETVAKAIDEVFDIAIITGDLNRDILLTNIHKAQKIILNDKSKMQETLSVVTKSYDLILFANDAPSYI